jgi:hypothetical protein
MRLPWVRNLDFCFRICRIEELLAKEDALHLGSLAAQSAAQDGGARPGNEDGTLSLPAVEAWQAVCVIWN